MPVATVTSKGQVTIPKVVRQALQIEAGDQLDFIVESNSRVLLLRPGRKAMELYGMLRREAVKPLTVEQMDRAVGRYHDRENARIKKARRARR